MDFERLAELLYPQITKTPADYETMFPQRNLPEGAMVTRMAPSPTGFMHLGNLFGALTDERLAHQSGGIFLLRIEDTDAKREVEGGVETIIKVFQEFELPFDEGVTDGGEQGAYGPYYQRQRAEIYQTFAKQLVREGKAYPCFCTEEELTAMHEQQEQNKENFGYYGKWARHRTAALEEIEADLQVGKPFVLRLRAPDYDPEAKVEHNDLVKGKMIIPRNDQDMVLLKSDGIPTYHFAHAVDDHLMRITHVVRGEEWLATLPLHLMLFDYLGWQPPYYVHTAQLMKLDNGNKRKLSKRKDPELALDYYSKEGYPVVAVKEYLLTLLNSNFEQWRMEYPDLPLEQFLFTTEKMGVSGALFDVDKLKDVSKNVIATFTAQQGYEAVAAWANQYDQSFYQKLTADPAFSIAILAIGRGGEKPRKDLALWSETKQYMAFFFDDWFEPAMAGPESMNRADVLAVLRTYRASYCHTDTAEQWFDRLKEIAASIGYAADMKVWRKNKDAYPGHVGDVSQVIRLAITGRTNSPDLYSVQQVLGETRAMQRIDAMIKTIEGA